MGTTWDREEWPEVIYITVGLTAVMNCLVPRGHVLIDAIFTVHSHLASSPKAGILSCLSTLFRV